LILTFLLTYFVFLLFPYSNSIATYVPPSYDENPMKVYDRILLMHDGQNLFNASTSFGGVAWEVHSTMDRLLVAGSITDMIVVGVYNTGSSRIFEYTHSYDPIYGGGGADLYLDFLQDTLLPLVKEKYRVVETAEVYMMGSSLGGLLSCYTGWTRPEVYSKVGCMSSSFWWNGEDYLNDVLPSRAPPVGSSTFYLDAAPGDALETSVAVQQYMLQDEIGFTLDRDLFFYVDPTGTHSERSWRDRLHVPLQKLFNASEYTVETDLN
jgi:predicted alpha/beta superfamily hydrolase